MKIAMAASALMMCAAPALATMTYLTQFRTVQAQAQGTAPGDPSQDVSNAAPDFGPYNHVVNATTSVGNASALQNSSLSSSALSVASTCTASASNAFNPIGTSAFVITFNIDAPTPYTLVGNWTVVYGQYTVQLTKGAETLFESISTVANSGSVNQSGTLTAGDYRLVGTVIANNGPGFDPASNLNVTLTVPSPGVFSLGAIGLLACGRRRR